MPRDGTSLDLGTDLAHALNAAIFAEDRLGFVPDDWQADLLRSTAVQIIVCVARQTGKSTTTAIKGLHTAVYDPGLVLLVSPSLRQSRELFGKVTGFLKDLHPAEILEEDNKSSCTLANGSRIVSLPGDARTIRGYSSPKLIIVDEAAYVDHAMFIALRPMRAATPGGCQLILLSTPNGRQSGQYFFETWFHGQGWERYEVRAAECPRISSEFLANERRELGELLFSQEYELQFIDAESAVFSSELISTCFVDDFEPFFS
jgi:hypothetical protein